MQPSTKQGRNLRLSLLPLSWVVAGLTVYLVLLAVAAATHSTVRGVMRTGSYWMLAVILPAFLFGKCFGLVALNLLARAMPAFRRTFERESAGTGRPGFARATSQLLWASLVLGLFTVIGGVSFVRCAGCGQPSSPSGFVTKFNASVLIGSLSGTLTQEQCDALRNGVGSRQILNTEHGWSSRVFDFELPASHVVAADLLAKWKALAELILQEEGIRFAHQGASQRDLQILYWPKGKSGGAAHLFLTETQQGRIRVIGAIYEY